MVRHWFSAALLTTALTACADTGTPSPVAAPPSAGAPATGASPGSGASPGTPPSVGAPGDAPSTSPAPVAPATPAGRVVASMSISAIGVRGLKVVPYAGTADDRPGTVIQNRRVAASPRGPRGGVGPGEVGNYIVTAHRTTHGRPFGRVPELENGDHVLITANGTVYDYLINRTMTISFRKPAELAQQNAAVPGRPGVTATQAMITLSTCATTEDHAAGNYWKDALGNPEHRINKIGVLVATRPA